MPCSRVIQSLSQIDANLYQQKNADEGFVLVVVRLFFVTWTRLSTLHAFSEEIDTIFKIFRVLGTPDEEVTWKWGDS